MKTYLDLFLAWFKMGLFTFGGGYAMLPMIQREAIEKYHWVTNEEIMDYYAIGQCTPGIIAVNTATFVGIKVKGKLGGIVATLGVVSPSIIIISFIASFISNYSELEIVQHALNGIQVAVCVLLIKGIQGLYKNGVKDKIGILFLCISFILSYYFHVSTIVLVLIAGVCGYLLFLRQERNGEAV